MLLMRAQTEQLNLDHSPKSAPSCAIQRQRSCSHGLNMFVRFCLISLHPTSPVQRGRLKSIEEHQRNAGGVYKRKCTKIRRARRGAFT